MHTSVYDIDPTTWLGILDQTKRILSDYLKPGMSLLDAGCAYGSASAYLPEGIEYLGVDLSPDFIDIARIAYPTRQFKVADVREMHQYADHRFDFTLCRSVRRIVIDNLGQEEWDKMQRELLRVAKKLILIEYEDLPKYEVLTGT